MRSGRICSQIPVALQGVLPTREELAERAQLAEARDKLVKLVVSSIMDYRVNSIPAAAACLHVLSTLVHNVLGSPLDPKMRQVRPGQLAPTLQAFGRGKLLALCSIVQGLRIDLGKVVLQVKVASKAFSTRVTAVNGESLGHVLKASMAGHLGPQLSEFRSRLLSVSRSVAQLLEMQSQHLQYASCNSAGAFCRGRGSPEGGRLAEAHRRLRGHLQLRAPAGDSPVAVRLL